MHMENNTPQNESSIHDLLEQSTEQKPQSTVTSKMWNFGDVEEAKEITQGEETAGGTSTGDDPEEKPAGKITEKAKRASARTAVGMLNLIQKSVFTPIISYKYKKKFTEEEINQIETKNLVDANKDHLHDDDLLLKNKWDRLMRKCSKKMDAIELQETEQKDLEEAFFVYFDYKEKTLPPEWFIGAAVINAFGKRLVDVITD